MTETSRAATDGLELRRRRLLFRSWHRGMREADLILGRFADTGLAALTEEEIEQYERLLEIPDTELLPWLTGERAVPDEVDTPVLRKILASRRPVSY